MKKKLLMSVYHPIEIDGRVQRSIFSLKEKYKVYLFSPSLNKKFQIIKNDNVVYLKHIFPWKRVPTIVSLITFWIELSIYSILIRPQIIYGHDRYLSLITLLISKILKIKSIYDAHELILPEKKRKLEYLSSLLHISEKISISKFDLVISANKERARIMKRFYKLRYLPLSILNIAQSTIGTISKEFVESKYLNFCLKENQKYIVYSGYLGLDRGILFFIDLMHYLPSNINLILIGSGPAEKYIDSLKKNKPTIFKRIIKLGRVPNHHLQDILSFFDLGIIYYQDIDINNRLCSSNKIYEYAYAGLPVVTTNQRSLGKIINNFKIGLTCNNKDNQAKLYEFSEKILKVLYNHHYYKSNLKEFSMKNSFFDEQYKLVNTILNKFQ